MPAKRHSASVASRVAAQKPGSKRAKGASGGKAQEQEPEGDAFFLDDGLDEQQQRGKVTDVAGKAKDQEAEEEARETVEEKRHRLAKQYLTQLESIVGSEYDDKRGVTGGSDDEDEDAGEEGARGRDRLTEMLKQDAAQAAGRVQRHLAREITLPTYANLLTAGTARRGHRLSATALALAHDDSTCWTVSKDGGICRWDMTTGTRTKMQRPTGKAVPVASDNSRADWVRQAARATSHAALQAAAVSSDGALLAVAGGDKRIHVFDGRTGTYVQAFAGHRDAVTALSFREGSHNLFSGSLDRTVKIWSLDDKAYMDTLFGHQQEVLGLDIGRAERAVSCGADRTCRIWKIPEESQLIFKYGAAGAAQTLDCCRFITGTDWVSGSSDGMLQLWTQLKRKPVAVVRNAHGPSTTPCPTSAGRILTASPLAVGTCAPSDAGAGGGADVTGWVQSVATARGSDLVASGAGDGAIRLWQVTSGKAGGVSGLASIGALPARGWVNGLAIARSGRFVVAAMGQEPRLGRWARDGAAHNGLLIHQLTARGGSE